MKIETAQFEMSAALADQLPPDTLPEVAFSGRSNVGKSSLINKILSRKNLARTSATPGKTAAINFYKLSTARFIDLPGYGFAKVSDAEKRRWRDLIGGYFAADRDLRLVMQLIDMRHAPTNDDLQMINFMIESEIPFALVFTKADKLSKREREERMQGFAKEIPYFDDIERVEFSAQTGEGADKMRQIIEELAEEN